METQSVAADVLPAACGALVRERHARLVVMTGTDERDSGRGYGLYYVFALPSGDLVSIESQVDATRPEFPSSRASCRRRTGTSARSRICLVSSRAVIRTRDACAARGLAARTSSAAKGLRRTSCRRPRPAAARAAHRRAWRRRHRDARRADPRRDHRAGALPLRRRRRARVPARGSPLLYAPWHREGG